MEEEQLFDYGRGINAPYWIQEIKSPKGKRIWYFSTPMQVSFLLFFLSFDCDVSTLIAVTVVVSVAYAFDF